MITNLVTLSCLISINHLPTFQFICAAIMRIAAGVLDAIADRDKWLLSLKNGR